MATSQTRPWVFHDNEYTGEYDINRFYTKGSDSKGHRSQLRVGMPPTLARMISEIVARQIVPEYQTSADFLRDALYHRLVWLSDNYELLQNREELKRARVWAQFQDRMAELENYRQTVEEVKAMFWRSSDIERSSVVAYAQEMIAMLPVRYAEELTDFLLRYDRP